MAIELIVEVLNHAPAELTSAERLVLIVIAEAADRKTRKCWPRKELIAQRAGLELSGLKKVFQRLASRGLEVRIPIGKDKRGRLVFAHEGHRSNYLLPRLDLGSDKRGDARDPSRSEEGPQSPSGGTTGTQREDHRATQSFTEPSKEPSSSRSSYRDRIAVVTGADDEEINLIIEQIKGATTGTVRNLGALIASISDDDIRDHHEAVVAGNAERSAATRRADMETQRRWAETQSRCDHGADGGWLIRPHHADPYCPMCRRTHSADPDAYLAMVDRRMQEEGIR